MARSVCLKPSRLSHLRYVGARQWLMIALVFLGSMGMMILVLGNFWQLPRVEAGIFLGFTVLVPGMASYLAYANVADEARDREHHQA